jgi:hypothetical protein
VLHFWVLFSCLAYRAGVRRAFRLVLILVAWLFSDLYYLGWSNPLHVTFRFSVHEAQNRNLKRIGISALVVLQEPQANKPVDICYV